MRASISIRDHSGFSVGRGKANRGIMVYWIFGKFFEEGRVLCLEAPLSLIGYHVITAHHFLAELDDCDEGRIGADAGDLWFFVVLKESGFFPLRSWLAHQTIHPNDYNDEKGSFGQLMH